MYQQDRDTSWRCLQWKAKSIWVPRGFISVQGELVALQGVRMDVSVLSYVWMQRCFDWWRWSGGWLSPCENPLGRLGLGKNLRTFLKGLKCLLMLLGSNSDSSVDPSCSLSYFRYLQVLWHAGPGKVMLFFSSFQLGNCLYALEAPTALYWSYYHVFWSNWVPVLMVQYCVLSAFIYLMWWLAPVQQALE